MAGKVKISDSHDSPKWLRHGFQVKTATDTKSSRLVLKWLGKRGLETTTFYIDAAGEENASMELGFVTAIRFSS